MSTIQRILTTMFAGAVLGGCATAAPTDSSDEADAMQRAEADQARELDSCILFANQGDYQNAIRACKDATETGSSNARQTAAAYANLGVAYTQIGKLNLALDALERAEARNSNDPFILYNIAAVHSLRDDTDLSLEYLDQALASGFDNFDALRFDRDLDNVRGEPEFRTVLEDHHVFIQ